MRACLHWFNFPWMKWWCICWWAKLSQASLMIVEQSSLKSQAASYMNILCLFLNLSWEFFSLISKGEWSDFIEGRTEQEEPFNKVILAWLARVLSNFSLVKLAPFLLLAQVNFGPKVGISLKPHHSRVFWNIPICLGGCKPDPVLSLWQVILLKLSKQNQEKLLLGFSCFKSDQLDSLFEDLGCP